MKLFLDANVLFSAAYSPVGNARSLMAAASERGFTMLVTDHVLGEAIRNVTRKAAHALASLEALEGWVHVVPAASTTTEAAVRALGIVLKDAPVLAAAIDCQADVFVTGDARHFGHLYGQSIRGVRVLALRAAYEMVAAQTLRPSPSPTPSSARGRGSW